MFASAGVDLYFSEMGAFKWIAGILGWVAWGPIGAILGYAAASALENTFGRARQLPENNSGTGSRRQQYQQQQQGRSSTSYNSSSRSSYTGEEQRNSFFISLIVLSAAVIKADGRTLESEKNVVKDFVRRSFGDAAVYDAIQILERSLAQDINIYSVGGQIATYMNYSQRLQLLHYLAQIANADSEFHKSEKSIIEAIGRTIGLSDSDVNSVIAMFYKETTSAYDVLGISPSATNDEVKSAYRKMAMKNHPDKVATLGPEVQKAAERKFREIHSAYETIKKERGMS